MDTITNLYRRACDESDPNSDACAKPTSKVLLDAVPAAVVGVYICSMLLVAGIAFFIIARKRRRQFDAEEAKERESLEIEIYEPTANSHHHNPAAHADPFNDPHGLSRDPDYNEFSLAPPQSRLDHSPSKSSIATESTYVPRFEISAPPPAYHEGNIGAAVQKQGDTKV